MEYEKAKNQATLVEQVKRVKEIEAIESDSFVQQTFRSSKEVKKSVEPTEVKHTTAASGQASVAADMPTNEKEIDPSIIPTTIKYQDDNSLAHPNNNDQIKEKFQQVNKENGTQERMKREKGNLALESLFLKRRGMLLAYIARQVFIVLSCASHHRDLVFEAQDDLSKVTQRVV
ncbi:Serine/Arginine-Related Protein 53 [Manis pentadactyla]|nr:Serine/Arginine-Related Protein 53 [Manis pentadactyla]